MNVTRFCPAKVNLFLEVTGKRPNGYHELATLFAKIDLGDTLHITAEESAKTHISLRITGPQGKHIPCSPQNLVWKAAQQFLEQCGLTARIHLHLDKHVPTGAGLGGGSSDAAGVLLGLCEIFNKNPLDFLPLAARLGADVPLFLYPDTFLKGEGIGEKLTPIPAPQALPQLVLVYPQVAVSTPGIFGKMTLPAAEEILTNVAKLDKLINVVRNGLPLTAWKPLLFNRLEEYVLPFVSPVKKALTALAPVSNGICRMSGSGSTVFALVGTNQDAWNVTKALQHIKMLVYPVSFYRSPSHANYRNKNTSRG